MLDYHHVTFFFGVPLTARCKGSIYTDRFNDDLQSIQLHWLIMNINTLNK